MPAKIYLLKHTALAFLCLAILQPLKANTKVGENYVDYHVLTIQADELIANGSFGKALEIHEQIMDSYSFVFLRQYRIATQLAWHLDKKAEAFKFLKLAIASGWEMSSIKKNKFLKGLRKTEEWDLIKEQYDSLRGIYFERIDIGMQSKIRSMSIRDQKKALGALFRIGSKAQDNFGEKKFAPQNEMHVIQLIEMINDKGYPGEKLAGCFGAWPQGILSRHNSISRKYCKQDTLYAYVKPLLISAIGRGEMIPYNLAVVDEWFTSVESGWSVKSYGLMAGLNKEDITNANQLRTKIGLRTVETRNRLIDMQEKTRMNFYLPPWPKRNGKIELVD